MSTHLTQRLGNDIEFYCPPSNRRPILHSVLDFDGNLSLIRAGWQEVTLNQCIAEPEKTPTPTNRDNLFQTGNGYVETENTRALGAATIGVASLENGATGWDLWKKDRLRAAGAQILVPYWQESTLLLSLLCGEFDD